MSERADAEAPPQVASWELLLLVLGIVLIGTTLLAIANAFSLIGRNYWLDEIYTHTLVADPDPVHAFRALADGVETHPPTYYALVRIYGLLVGGIDETRLRVFSLLCVALALVAVYLTSRRTWTAYPAALATLAVALHPLTLRYALEGRHYALWLTELAWLICTLAWYRAERADGRRGLAVGIALAVLSMLLCTTHYFGVLSLGLVLAGVVVVPPRARSSRWTGVLPALAGLLALAACLPLLRGQRRAMTVATWIADPSPFGISQFLREMMPLVPALVLGLGLLWILARRPVLRMSPELGGMGALLLIPWVLVVMSFTLQPVYEGRYAIPVVLSLAPLVGFLANRGPRFVPVFLCAVMFHGAWTALRVEAATRRGRDAAVEQRIAFLRSLTNGPVAFEWAHDLYEICFYSPELRDRCYYIDFERGQLGREPPVRIFARDLARAYVRHYERPQIMPWETYRALDRRYLVAAPKFIWGVPAGYDPLTPQPLEQCDEHRVYELTD